MRDGDRGGGEGTLGDGITNNGEGGGKEFVLMLERREKSWRNVGQS